MSTASYGTSFNLLTVLSESNRIINGHSRHFLALWVLFLLPLSFSPVFYHPAVHSQSDSMGIGYISQQSKTKTELFGSVLYFIVATVLSLCAMSTITYTTFHGYNGKPVNLVSSIKSILLSFFPLLSTYTIYKLTIFLIIMSFTIFLMLVVGFLIICYGTDYVLYSKINYLMAFLVVPLVFMLWLQVNWSLWSVIVVVESKWWYEPLKRSRYLVNGMRRVVFPLLLTYGFAIGFLIGSSYACVEQAKHASGWLRFGYVLVIVLSPCLSTILTLYYLVSNVVLYMNGKALHGEISEELGDERVSLAFDYEKVLQV